MDKISSSEEKKDIIGVHEPEDEVWLALIKELWFVPNPKPQTPNPKPQTAHPTITLIEFTTKSQVEL